MNIRDGRFEPQSGSGAAPDPAGVPETAPVDRVAYRVPTRFMVIKFAVAVVFALGGLLAPDRLGLAIGLLVAAGTAIYAARDLFAPVRLAADVDGVVAVRGYASRVRLAWPEIEQVRVDSRLRFGRRAEQLEIDAGELILLFSAFDLGVSPTEAAQALAHLRADGPLRS